MKEKKNQQFPGNIAIILTHFFQRTEAVKKERGVKTKRSYDS